MSMTKTSDLFGVTPFERRDFEGRARRVMLVLASDGSKLPDAIADLSPPVARALAEQLRDAADKAEGTGRLVRLIPGLNPLEIC